MSARRFALLGVLLAASGCAALIYQVVWFQLLGLVIGASALSLGALLGTFMGGMCLGAVLLPRFMPMHRHPLHVYAALEIGIALLGLGVLYAMPTVGRVYFAWAGDGITGLIVRVIVTSLCLLPPTILIGATLPAIARLLTTTRPDVARLGVWYGANIAGAVVGCVLAAFYLLRSFDVAAATWAAAALNLGVAGASFAIAGRAHHANRPTSVAHAAVSAPWPIYATAALSGFTALAAEVLWTRQLSLLLGGTVYAFALILAVFLAGLGIGSGVGASLARRTSASVALGYCQLLLCAALAWSAYALTQSLPYWPLDVTLPTASGVTLQLDLIRVAYAILPAALLWGTSFPLALAAAARPGQDPSGLVARVYVANTIGAIAGALATSFVLIVWLGSERTQQILIVVSAGAALLMLAVLRTDRDLPRRARAAAAAILAAIVLVYTVPPLPAALVAYGRFLPTRGLDANVLYAREGLTASIAVSRQDDGTLTYHAAGKAQASTYPQDMRLQRMLGHLTTLLPDRQKSFLVIGLGAGITAGAVSIDPAAERVVIAELEPLAVHAAAEYFTAHNFGVVSNPKVEIRLDDGRHFLSTTRETFDGITSDPLDPWVKGAAALYTREFWELVESRLNPGGVVTVFLQLYESTEAAVKSEVATFFEVFPNGAVFANTVQGTGYDAVLIGLAGDAPIDIDRLHARLQSREYEHVAASLRQVGLHSATDLLGAYAAQAADLTAWLEDAAINTDRNLRLQYLAGEGLNLYRADEILQSLLSGSSRFPDGLFAGSAARLNELRQRLRAPQDYD